ncbi:MAG: hypothetical protein ABSE92_07445 [Terriglobales bacterium]
MSKTWLSFFFILAFTALMCASAAAQNNFKVIHSFAGYPNDGMTTDSSVVFDKLGNMYGATDGGGGQTGCGDFGCGTVYELSPDGQGNWTEIRQFIWYDLPGWHRSAARHHWGRDCLRAVAAEPARRGLD